MHTAPPTPTAAAVHNAIPRDTAKEIADYMRANPGCTFDDLRAEGFSSRQIERFKGEASDLANRLSVRRLA
ncbi:hypothetical protein [Rhizobium sp. GCM10022189]|uniref:hypothetical protein n=1 Tax=Rhizobium sp. GCM10022189 TaxID=3252654 RepID=UPI003619BC5A